VRSTFLYRKSSKVLKPWVLDSLAGYSGRAEMTVFLQRQASLYDALGQTAVDVLKGIDTRAAALVTAVEKGLAEGSGGGMAGEASLSSLAVQRTDLSGSLTLVDVPQHVDCSLLTAIAVPAGDFSLRLFDKGNSTYKIPAAMVPSGAKWSIALFPGHLFDVVWGKGGDSLAVPHEVKIIKPAAAAPVSGGAGQAVAGAKRTHGKMEGGNSNDRFSFVLRLLPHEDTELVPGSVASETAAAVAPLLCSEVIKKFRESSASVNLPKEEEKEEELKAETAVKAPARAEPVGIRVFIKTMTGKVFPLDVKSNDVVYTVKVMIQEREGIPVNQMLLQLDGKNLAYDDVTLAEYGVKDGSDIKLILRLRGD
jgi:Ubiquitin family